MNIQNIEIQQQQIVVSKSQKCGGEIILFGDDNQYPSQMQSLIESSETATSCVQSYSKFIATSFVDENIGKTAISRTSTGCKYTLNKLVKEIATSLAKFNGAYILVNKNLAGQVVSAEAIDFKTVRFSSFDDSGRSNFAYVGDWSSDIKNFGKISKTKFNKYPLFTTETEVFKAQSAFTKTTASIYHIFLDEQYIYPASTFEQVVYDMASECEIQKNRYFEVTEGSPSKLVIRTDFSGSEEEEAEQEEEIRNFAGSSGNRVLIIKTQFDEQGNPIENGYKLDVIPDTRDLSKFADAEKSCANNIRKCINIPQILIDYESATGINVSAEQMKSAVDYFDELCVDIRDIVSESLSEIFNNTTIDFKSKDFRLKKKTIRQD